jgi:hypothetical protein
MKRILLIILWVILFLFVGSMLSGLGIGVLIGFTDFPIEGNEGKIVAVSNLISILSILIGLYLGIKEKLPGTKKAADVTPAATAHEQSNEA